MGRGVCAPAGVGQVIARDLPGSLQLAFVGDTVYDLFVRERLARGGGRMDDLHRAAVRYVCAAAQSEALARVEPLLTEEEAAVVRRARNARQTPPRHAEHRGISQGDGAGSADGRAVSIGRYGAAEGIDGGCDRER